jgi:hypothetical protein
MSSGHRPLASAEAHQLHRDRSPPRSSAIASCVLPPLQMPSPLATAPSTAHVGTTARACASKLHRRALRLVGRFEPANHRRARTLPALPRQIAPCDQCGRTSLFGVSAASIRVVPRVLLLHAPSLAQRMSVHVCNGSAGASRKPRGGFGALRPMHSCNGGGRITCIAIDASVHRTRRVHASMGATNALARPEGLRAGASRERVVGHRKLARVRSWAWLASDPLARADRGLSASQVARPDVREGRKRAFPDHDPARLILARG